MASKTKLKRQITIETHSVTIIRTNDKSNSVFCEICQQIVTAFSIDQFASLFQMDLDEVCRQIESGKIHLTTSEGNPPVCGNSLVN